MYIYAPHSLFRHYTHSPLCYTCIIHVIAGCSKVFHVHLYYMYIHMCTCTALHSVVLVIADTQDLFYTNSQSCTMYYMYMYIHMCTYTALHSLVLVIADTQDLFYKFTIMYNVLHVHVHTRVLAQQFSILKNSNVILVYT